MFPKTDIQALDVSVGRIEWPIIRSFGPPSHALVVYHLERSRLPLQDAVGVNCKKDATTENQDAGAWYIG